MLAGVVPDERLLVLCLCPTLQGDGGVAGVFFFLVFTRMEFHGLRERRHFFVAIARPSPGVASWWRGSGAHRSSGPTRGRQGASVFSPADSRSNALNERSCA
jgi:hypothetical protein